MKNFTSIPWKVLTFVAVILLIVTSPFWIWQLKGSKDLNVLIMDKTVPDTSYREHKGLVWLLNNEKYKLEGNRTYSFSKDYKGVSPSGSSFKVHPLPKNLDKYDVYYITDQYGVYDKDINGRNETGERSSKIYGGLEAGEVNQLEQALLQTTGKTLIAEFNTFASPASEEVKDKMANLLNADWSGWIGRYFDDLSSNEVPVWVKKLYEEGNRKWDYKGYGLILVNQNDEIIVLDQKSLKQNGATFTLTSKGQEEFGKNISPVYQYWFDIVSARNNEDILANYELKLTDQAKRKLNGLGIPSVFPAVIHHVNAKYSSYYFAGDYADESDVPSIYQTSGISEWRKMIDSKKSFYWSGYVPIMKSILHKGIGQHVNQETVEINQSNGINTNSKTNQKYIQILKDGKWENLLIKGVNMGIAKPGYFPGEAAITKEEYLKWFQQIGEMNANTIRVYTLHPPAFYEAFYEYNQTAEKPLFLIHGAWVNEESLVATQDAYSEEVTSDFRREMKEMIDIVHGNAVIEKIPGHAYGEYKKDISRYVLGYMLGIEWDPNAVANTNKKHSAKPPYSGKYFKTANASPFEGWLAENMDYATSYETEKYHWQHSMSFTNWPTTDMLHHPAEPSPDEDKATVDPNHIEAQEGFHSGLFASYHIYPYYPDFMNYEKNYVDFKDSNGKQNNYAGYLHDLIQKHNMPVLVAEFGVPSSRGLTHRNASGMDQGFHSEKEQGNIDARLFHSIVDQGYAGGLVFTWQDEWFKRTWNTMDLDDPDRRPYWTNVQTNEQHFGLLGFEPDSNGTPLYVDGNTIDWNSKNSNSLYESNGRNNNITSIRASSDEGYFYLNINFKNPVDMEEDQTYVLLDTIDGQGQKTIPLNGGQKMKTDFGIDFMAEVSDKDHSRLYVDSYYDSFYYQYANQLKLLPQEENANKKDSGKFHTIQLALNKPLLIPSTGLRVPFQSYEAGKFRFGNANPLSQNFDSLTDISISNNKKSLELRIPWLNLNIKDPSQKEALGDLWTAGLESKVKIDGIRAAVVFVKNGKMASTLPKQKQGVILKTSTTSYTWNEWEQPRYSERLKESYTIMKNTFKNTTIKERAN